MLLGKDASVTLQKVTWVQISGVEQGWLEGTRPGTGGRNEGCPRTELSSPVTRLQRDKRLGKGRNWSPPPAGQQSFPQSGSGGPGLVPKYVSAASYSRPLPPRGARGVGGCGGCADGAGSRASGPAREGGGRRGGASAPPGALFPAALPGAFSRLRDLRADGGSPDRDTRGLGGRTDRASRQTPSGRQLHAGPC